MNELKSIFNDYASCSARANIITGIDGTRFAKFCKDTHLYDKYFRKEESDILFARFKESGHGGYLSFNGFTMLLSNIAMRKKISFEELIEVIINQNPTAGPTNGVQPLPNRFYDDVQLYTGVHKAGGPSVIDNNHMRLDQMVDRSVNPIQRNDSHGYIQLQPFNVNGITNRNDRMSDKELADNLRLMSIEPPPASNRERHVEPNGSANHIHQTSINNQEFQNYFQPPNPIPSQSATFQDRNFNQFNGLPQYPPANGMQYDPSDASQSHAFDIMQQQYYQYIYQMQQYYQMLGYPLPPLPPPPPHPHTADVRQGKMRQSRSMSPPKQRKKSIGNEILDSSVVFNGDYNRSVQKGNGEDRNRERLASHLNGGNSSDSLHRSSFRIKSIKDAQIDLRTGLLMSQSSGDAADVHPHQKQINTSTDSNQASVGMNIRHIYNEYIVAANGIDSARFLRFCKDYRLFDSLFRFVDVDIVFMKFKEDRQRFLSYRGFKYALNHIAMKKQWSIEVMNQYLLDKYDFVCKMKLTHAIIPPTNKFHDDIRLYTGVHKAGGPTVYDRDHKDLKTMVNRG